MRRSFETTLWRKHKLTQFFFTHISHCVVCKPLRHEYFGMSRRCALATRFQRRNELRSDKLIEARSTASA